jgi:cleavage and polyadenylation specificity factor subunit 2
MFRLTPIYGSQWCPQGQAQEPNCTLVEYGECRVLWNVGSWCLPVKGDTKDAYLAANIPDHDCLILSNSTLTAAGGLPIYFKTRPTPVPIYATFPTVKLLQMNLYHQHAAICLDGGTPPFTLQELDTAITSITCIKYSQGVKVWNPYDAQPSLTITAHRAGHVVGAAFFVFQGLHDETTAVLTDLYHIARELHLDSSTLLQHGSSADVLVTRPGGPSMRLLHSLSHGPSPALPPQLVTQMERNLVESVVSVLRRDGNVLLPADASGRVLELILLLNQHWERNRLKGVYTLVWLGPMVCNTAELARSQLEWMALALGNYFDVHGSHWFALKNVQLMTSIAELNAWMEDKSQNPTCVVASGLDMDAGPSRDLLLQWADNPDNAIIFTDSSGGRLRRSTVSGGTANVMNPTSITGEAAVADNAAASNNTAVNVNVNFNNNTPFASNITATNDVIAMDTTATTVATEGLTALPGSASLQPRDQVVEEGDMVGTVATHTSQWTVAGQLLQAWYEAQKSGEEMDDAVVIDIPVPHRVPLSGSELQAFLADEEATRQRQVKLEEERAMLREVELAKGQLRLVEEDTEKPGTAMTTAARKLPNMPRKKSRFDASLFLKFSKPLHCKCIPAVFVYDTQTICCLTCLCQSMRDVYVCHVLRAACFSLTFFLSYSALLYFFSHAVTFEIHEEAVGIGQPDVVAKYGIGESIGRAGEVLEDDYGIAVLPEKFTDIVSGVDPSKFAGGSGRIGDEVMRRGLGYANDAKGSKKSAKVKSSSARVSEDEDQDSLQEQDEADFEAMDLSEGRGIIRGRNGRPPTKVMTVARKLEVLAEVFYIPLEGRVDSRAARQSVRALQPGNVIVLGGLSPTNSSNGNDSVKEKDNDSIDEAHLLAEAVRAFLKKQGTVETPADGHTVELHVGHAAYAVRLVDTPYVALDEASKNTSAGEPKEMSEVKLGSCSVSLIDAVATGQKVAADGSIVLAPRVTPSADIPSVYVSDGEVLLTDLRAELIAQGMKAEYSSHTGYAKLVVNRMIVVRKELESGHLSVEGPLCEDFYTVRSIVCGQYVTL